MLKTKSYFLKIDYTSNYLIKVIVMLVLKYFSVFLIGVMICQYTLAYSPLNVENLTVDENKFKLKSDLSYFNQLRRNLNEQGYSFVDLGNGR